MTDESKAVVTEFDGKPTCFYFENGILTEVFSETDSDVCTGDIYVGKVMNVRRDLKAVFLDIKPGVPAFLPFNEIAGFDDDKHVKGIKQGDEFPVMILSQAQKNKPCKVSTNLAIHGLYCVAVSDDEAIHVSSKLCKEDRDRLKNLAKDLNPKTGLIIRTKSAVAPDSDVISEIVCLSDKLHEILQTSSTRTAFSRVYEAKPSFYERINELGPKLLLTDSESVLKSASVHINRERCEVSFYKDKTMPLSILYGLSSKLEESRGRKVNLKSGGFIIIEPTEAMTVIDVNSGKTDAKRTKKDLITRTNTEAAVEVFRQIRLRNISGMIIVDFINNDSKEDEDALKELMKGLAAKDPVKTVFVDITKLRLAEITRQKKYETLK